MSELGLRFLLANAAAGIAILAVILLRKPARAMFGPRLAYALWLLAPLAAMGSLLPARIVETAPPAQAFEAMPSAPLIVPEIAPPPAASLAAPTAPAVETSPPAAPTLPPPPSTPLDPAVPAALLWLAGALAMAAWQMRGQSRFVAHARAGVAGPAVAGFLRPRIITPSDFEDRFDLDERKVILAHESIHLTRNDARMNALIALVRCICWFNPLIHAAAHLMRIDQELACDATVVARYPRAKAAYASALLKAQLSARPVALPVGCYWPERSEHPLMQRVEMLKQPAPGRARRFAGLSAVAILALGAGLTAWAAMPPSVRMKQAAPLEDKPAPQQQPAATLKPEWAGGARSNPTLDANALIRVHGRIEAIDFSDTTYIIHIRADSVTWLSLKDSAFPATYPNAEMWQISPTNYWGDPETRAAIRADLMGKVVEARGENLAADCKPSCQLKADALMTARSGEAPKPQANASLIAEFANQYDTSQRKSVEGIVERIDFSDRTFDAYIRKEDPETQRSQLFQVRAENHFPRADVERALLNRSVAAMGWPARQPINTFCDPICGMFATEFQMQNRTVLTPAGAKLETEYVGALRRPPGYDQTFDFDAPVTIQGKVIKVENPTPNQENLANVIWIEADRFDPATTQGAEPGTVWRAAAAHGDQDWVGKTITVKGFNAKDKSCQPTCLMSYERIWVR